MGRAQIEFDDDAPELLQEESAEETIEEAAGEQQEPDGAAEETSEGSPEESTEETQERIEFNEAQQRFINEHIVAKQVAKRKQLEEELEALRQRVPRDQADQSGDPQPQVPPLPNVWEDDYEAKIQARDQKIRELAAWEVRQEERQRYEREQVQRAQYEQQQQLLGQVKTYTERAVEMGISEQDLAVAGNAVAQFGIADDLVADLLSDDLGPAVVMHLSRNLGDLAQIQQMTPTRAAAFIESNVKPKVTRSLKRRQAPPEPGETPEGKGTPKPRRGPKGVTYE